MASGTDTTRLALRHMGRAGALLGLFAAVCVSLVALTREGTRDAIDAAERAALLRNLHAVVPAHLHDNDIAADVTRVDAPGALGAAPAAVYRARRGGEPVAAALTLVAPDGYSGAIRMLLGVHADGRVSGLRVLAHRETPGLGDGIEAARSDWSRAFEGRALGDPPAERWAVKRDGGDFDQFTGATITPRAVVKAVRRGLEFFAAEHETLFAREGAASP